MAIASTQTIRPGSRAGRLPGIRAHAGFIVAELLILIAMLIMIVIVKGHPGPLPGEVRLTLEVQRLLRPHPPLTAPLTAISTSNRSIPAGIITVVIIAIFALLRRWLDIAVMLGTLGAAWVANHSISVWIHRPRPGDFGGFVGRQIDVFSFPSGHVERALAFYGIVLFLTFQARHPTPWLWLVRIALLAQIVLMPLSRTLEGEHWPTDSLAGLLVGGFWLLAGIQVYLAITRRWPQLVPHGERSVRPLPSAPRCAADGAPERPAS